ncbi:hypothetical protein V9T40_010106 [Parthenolecanium corni]|uniref:Uncharacterized protein n=1 Tax=Parthenolecanium corni TaxID=536013 RepID=A0AAN9TP27_9HEMI
MIKFTLCGQTIDDTTNDDTISLQIGDAAKALDESILTAVREQVPIESPIDIEKMKQEVADYRVRAVKYAKSELDKVMTNVEDLQKEIANMKPKNALRKIEDQRKQAQYAISAIKKEASKKLKEGKKIINDKYKNDVQVSAAYEKLKKATEERDAARVTAEHEFEKIRDEMEGKKRTAENEHKDSLEQGRKQKQDADRSAKRRWSKAMAEYTRANRRRNLSSEAKKKLQKKYQEEKAIYDQSLKSAENKWQELLKDLGIAEQIRQCDETIKKAENEIDLALEKADSIYKAAYEEHKKLENEAKTKKREAEKLAEAEYQKFWNEFQDEYNKILQNLNEMKNKLR